MRISRARATALCVVAPSFFRVSVAGFSPANNNAPPKPTLHGQTEAVQVAIRRAQPDEMDALSFIVAEIFEEEPLQRWVARWEIYLGMLERLVRTSFAAGLDGAAPRTSPGARRAHALATLQELFVAEARVGDSLRIAGVVELAARDCPVPFGGGPRRAPFVCNLGVLEEYRGLGLGRSLLVHCEDAVVERGLPEMWLETSFANVPALRLYASQDFVAEGVDPEIRARSIFGDRRVFLRKRLSSDAPETCKDVLSFERANGDWEARYELASDCIGELTFLEKNFGALAPFVAVLGAVVGGILF